MGAAAMSLVWISPAPSSLRRARRCHACMCRGLLPNINGRAAEACDGTGESHSSAFTHVLDAVRVGQRGPGTRHDCAGGVVLGGWLRANGRRTLPRSVGSPVSCCGEQAVVAADRETFSRCSPGFTHDSLGLGRRAIKIHDLVAADLQAPTGKKDSRKDGF